jgi:hypothetical protein
VDEVTSAMKLRVALRDGLAGGLRDRHPSCAMSSREWLRRFLQTCTTTLQDGNRTLSLDV